MYKLEIYKYIQNVTLHPDYKDTDDPPKEVLANDVAVVELDSPFYWTQLVKPACLPGLLTSNPVEEYEETLMVSCSG